MKRAIFNAAAATVAGLYLAGCGGGGSAMPQMPPATSAPTQGVDAIIAQNFPNDAGVEVAFFRHGVPILERGYGLRDRGLPDTFYPVDYYGVPQPDTLFNLPRGRFAPDANTIFDLGSVSKEFTAGAILLLQQDGKLSVNDTLDKYFPGFPNGAAIPLLYLLQHRSGLVEYNNFGSYPDFATAYAAFKASGQTTYQPIVDRLATFPLKFKPGSAYDYSNTNYVLLGAIVAKVSGEPLGAFLQRRIFNPLHMNQTSQGEPTPPVTDFALGYRTNDGAVVRAWQWNLQWLAGPGGLTSTVGDIEKWDRAVRTTGIFTQASLHQMFAPGPFPQSYGTYADGWIVATLAGHRYIWHDGALGGYQTMNATFPDDDLDIVILTNDGTGLDPYDVVPQLFPIALKTSAARRYCTVSVSVVERPFGLAGLL